MFNKSLFFALVALVSSDIVLSSCIPKLSQAIITNPEVIAPKPCPCMSTTLQSVCEDIDLYIPKSSRRRDDSCNEDLMNVLQYLMSKGLDQPRPNIEAIKIMDHAEQAMHELEKNVLLQRQCFESQMVNNLANVVQNHNIENVVSSIVNKIDGQTLINCAPVCGLPSCDYCSAITSALPTANVLQYQSPSYSNVQVLAPNQIVTPVYSQPCNPPIVASLSNLNSYQYLAPYTNYAPCQCSNTPCECSNIKSCQSPIVIPFQSPNVSPCQCPNIAPCQCTNVAPCQCSNVSPCQCSSVASCQYSNVAPCQCTNIAPCQCPNIAQYQCPNIAQACPGVSSYSGSVNPYQNIAAKSINCAATANPSQYTSNFFPLAKCACESPPLTKIVQTSVQVPMNIRNNQKDENSCLCAKTSSATKIPPESSDKAELVTRCNNKKCPYLLEVTHNKQVCQSPCTSTKTAAADIFNPNEAAECSCKLSYPKNFPDSSIHTRKCPCGSGLISNNLTPLNLPCPPRIEPNSSPIPIKFKPSDVTIKPYSVFSSPSANVAPITNNCFIPDPCLPFNIVPCMTPVNIIPSFIPSVPSEPIFVYPSIISDSPKQQCNCKTINDNTNALLPPIPEIPDFISIWGNKIYNPQELAIPSPEASGSKTLDTTCSPELPLIQNSFAIPPQIPDYMSALGNGIFNFEEHPAPLTASCQCVPSLQNTVPVSCVCSCQNCNVPNQGYGCCDPLNTVLPLPPSIPCSDDDTIAILYKAKTVTLLDCYGSFLEQITQKVLVPYYATKLYGI